MSKERPILMNDAMVRAVLDGRKTQTRRVVTGHPGHDWINDGFGRITSKHPKQGRFGLFIRRGIGTDFPECDLLPCPHGQPGDRLWVREACQGWTFEISGENVVRYPADRSFSQIENSINGADRWIDLYNYRRKRGAVVPSIHMPRWASRILLEITGVRVERLKDISEANAKAEGAAWVACGSPQEGSHKAGFAALWESINGAGSWDVNPWVWVIEFKVVTA